MRARFLLGRAGAGKTFACLAEARAALLADPEGQPLIFLAPKQATFQLERQLLADASLGGYTRLRILSFERLAQFALAQLGQPPAALLSEQGRVMALRALLARRQGKWKIFRSTEGSARFATHVSQELREWQRRQYTPAGLMRLSERPELGEPLRAKLHDLSLLLGDYLHWLGKHQLQDTDCLLDLAARALEKAGAGQFPAAALWMDGFAEMSASELSLLSAVAPHCGELTLAFCLEPDAKKAAVSSVLSIWSAIDETRRECWLRLSKIPHVQLVEETLRAPQGRFAANPALDHLERHWSSPQPFDGAVDPTIRAIACATPEAEAVFAAQEIIRFVRDRGGRYREAAVLVRKMEGYGEDLRRVFSRYGIPYFLDRRESASHHPLAELTRASLRAAGFEWAHADWFGVLKTGLVSPDPQAIDRLENAALERGWKGDRWFHALPGGDETAASAERFRQKWIKPFAQFRNDLSAGGLMPPSGEQLAAAIRQLWRALRVEATLEEWGRRDPTHTTVLQQLNILLDDLARAFSGETLGLREWLAIIEAGLAGLTVGVIPPALDQVLIGAVDRSRNPELRLTILLGLNETIFPAPPRSDSLFSEADRRQLRDAGAQVGPSRLQLLGRENFLAYIACTRSHERVVLAWSERAADDGPLNPSPYLSHLRKLFPTLQSEKFSGPDWRAAERPCDLVGRFVEARKSPPPRLTQALQRQEFAPLRERLRLAASRDDLQIADLTDALYGPALRTSVSRLEDYAACAFKFFVRSGLRAEEREIFELDVRQRGTFQHTALFEFHDQLEREGKKWRDLTPQEGRERIRQIVDDLSGRFRDGLLASNPAARFSARTVGDTLGDFVAATIDWMRHYQFDPAAAELSFGDKESALPAWEIDLAARRRLIFRGFIDRVDLWREAETGKAFVAVMDYKSGEKKLEPILMRHGLQLQLAGYLAVLRRTAQSAVFGPGRLTPAGMFYVNLRGRAEKTNTRDEALRDPAAARQALFRHHGRFAFERVRQFDSSASVAGSQFNYKITLQGAANQTVPDSITSQELDALLDDVEVQLRRMGEEIFAGAIAPNPFQKGGGVGAVACQQCQFQAVCRFDPWTDSFRQLV